MAAIADSANVSQENKLNVLGVFDTINASQLPIQHPSLTFAFRILVESEDSNRHVEINASLIDEDSRPLWAAVANMQVGPIPAGQFTHLNQVITLVGIVFTRPGRYRFRLRLSGQDRPYDTVFQVVQIPPPQT